MNIYYYDLESLSNVFTVANFKEKSNTLDIYVLSDDPALTADAGFISAMKQRIYDKNKNFTGEIYYFDLHTKEANERLAKDFGLCTSNPFRMMPASDVYKNKYRLTDDTQSDYDEEKDAYIIGFNSYNYDTTMLAHYLYKAFIIDIHNHLVIQGQMLPNGTISQSVNAADMRDFNNLLFIRYKNNMPSALMDTGDGGADPNFDDPRRYIRLNMIKSGRHLDIARLNKTPEQMGLKRILGMLGYQILESDKLSQGQDVIHTPDELCDLIAYNVSDVVNLKELFHHPTYQGQFSLKKGLLKTYPDLIYRKKKNSYEPDVRPGNIKPDRLSIDSPSAQFATQCLCPYGHLTDLQAVSYMYPSEEKAKELGIPRVNVLDEARKFFHELYPGDKHKAIRDGFDLVYKYYKSIEGMNFNDSKYYKEDYAADIDDITRRIIEGEEVTPQEKSYVTAESLPKMQKYPCCLPYYDKDGNPTSCFALFSTGGVHGAEYNSAVYQSDLEKWEKSKADLEWVISQWPDEDIMEAGAFRYKAYTTGTVKQRAALPNPEVFPDKALLTEVADWKPGRKSDILFEGTIPLTNEKVILYDVSGPEAQEEFKDAIVTLTLHRAGAVRFRESMSKVKPIECEDGKMRKTVEMPDGRHIPYETFLKPGNKVSNSQWRDPRTTGPQLFIAQKDGSTTLNKRYTYTSYSYANHEDFTSYYPNLLRMMEAFKNPGLGYDRYAEIFDNKQVYGKKMKDKSLPEGERKNFSILREGTKLILNSASGAGDASFESNIRVNNAIISMRIIGQLFSWRIGQAQAYEGAKIISTNTDGLYSVMEETKNNAILEREAKNINVEIEPEPMYLISKDTNNRIELAVTNGTILSASGGTLACHKGPNPSKMLAHPAVLDWALREYLIRAAAGYKGLSLFKPMDMNIAMNILKSSESNKKEFPDDIKWLNMFQNIIASNPSSHSYVYGIPIDGDNTAQADADDTMKKFPNLEILQHYNRVFIMKNGTPGCMHLFAAKARKNNGSNNKWQTIANYVLEQNGEDTHELFESKRDIVTAAITNFSSQWYAFISNKSLYDMAPEEIKFIKDNIDYDKYLMLLRITYENNWANNSPEHMFSKLKVTNDDGTVVGDDDDTEDEMEE